MTKHVTYRTLQEVPRYTAFHIAKAFPNNEPPAQVNGNWVRIEDLRILIAQMEMAQRDAISALKDERDEADRRAGAAERKLASLEEKERRRDHWLEEAKVAAGHSTNTSFDTVWAEVLAAAKKNTGPDVEKVEAIYFIAYEGYHIETFDTLDEAKTWLKKKVDGFELSLDDVELRYRVGEINVHELMQEAQA